MLKGQTTKHKYHSLNNAVSFDPLLFIKKMYSYTFMVYKWLIWSCTIVPFPGTLQEAAGRKTGFAQICSRKICKSGAKMVNATLAYLFKTSCIIVCKFGIYHLCP